MRCGICKKDRFPDGTPISDVYFLNVHKLKEHPEEFQAAEKKQRATREATQLREARIASAVQAAAAQATGVVLRKWGNQAPDRIESIEDCSNPERYPIYHIAEPWLYAQYEQLISQAAIMLEESYQLGMPITEADVERVRQAVAEARQKAEKEVA